MYQGQMIFSQILEILPWRRFLTCVHRYHGDSNTHRLSTQAFFKIMVFAQLTGRESLRETVLCLNVVPGYLYHLGLPARLVKSNIAHANHRRHWKIFYDFAMILLSEARTLYQTTPPDFNFDGCVYALDSTTIDLCLSMFPYPHEIFHENTTSLSRNALRVAHHRSACTSRAERHTRTRTIPRKDGRYRRR